jgi:hypothetical protein
MRRILLLFVAAASAPAGLWAQGGAPLGPEFRVNTYTTNDQRYPAVGVSNGSGDFVVVWQSDSQDGSSYGAFGQHFAASGAPLGAEFQANTYTTSNQGHAGPSVAVDLSGNYVVTWSSYGQDGDGFGVFAQRYSSSGTPLGSEFRVNTATASHQGLSSVATDAAGNFVVVWMTSFPENVWGQRFASSGIPLGAEFKVNTSGLGAFGPVVASDAAGDFVVLWQRNDDTMSLGIFGRRFDASGSPLTGEFRVNTALAGNQYYPGVASDAAGNFVVIWGSADGSDTGVFAQRFASSGAPLGGEFRVNTYTTGVQGRNVLAPAVASDPAGNFVVVWGSDPHPQDGFFAGIIGQRFDGAGTPIGLEFRINTYTTNNQESPSVRVDGAGNFVVVWTSYSQDGSVDGVFGQRFGAILPAELTQFIIE